RRRLASAPRTGWAAQEITMIACKDLWYRHPANTASLRMLSPTWRANSWRKAWSRQRRAHHRHRGIALLPQDFRPHGPDPPSGLLAAPWRNDAHRRSYRCLERLSLLHQVADGMVLLARLLLQLRAGQGSLVLGGEVACATACRLETADALCDCHAGRHHHGGGGHAFLGPSAGPPGGSGIR